MFRHLSTKFFAADDRSSGGVITPTKEYNSESDILDELGSPDDDESEPDDKEDRKSIREDKEDKEDKKDDKDEKEEDEIELEDENEDERVEVEEERIDTPPRWKQLLKDYPGIDKKHPYLSKLFTRDRKYNEMFGSFDDAREAHQKAEILDEFETSLMAGNSENLLNRIKESDSKAFKKVANNLLPTLQKVDREAYLDVVSDVVNRVIVRMATEGQRLNNDQLKDAAVLVNQFVFGRSEFEPTRRTDDAEDPKNKDLEDRERAFEQRQLDGAVAEVSKRVSNTLRNTITAHIDPKNEMTAFERKHAINQALEYIDNSIGNDRGFRIQLDKLWKASTNDKLSDQSKDKIRVTILGKARTLLKTAITKARAEALKGNTRRNSDNDSDRESNNRRAPISRERHSTTQDGRERRSSGKNEMRKGETVLDFLSRD